MVPETYRIAFAALHAVWEERPCESLAVLLGSMRINPNDDISMDPACLEDWQQVLHQANDAAELDLILAYLDFDLSLYKPQPEDMQRLVVALRAEGSRERAIVDSVIENWNHPLHG